MKKDVLFLFAIVVFLLAGCTPKLSPEVQTAVAKLEKEGSYNMGSHVGLSGAKSEQWEVPERLSRIGSLKELTFLAKEHPSPVVRLCAFKALLLQSSQTAVSFAIRHMDDRSAVETTSGCSIQTESVADLRLRMIEDNAEKCHIGATDMHRIDSLVLYTPHMEHMYYLTRLLNRLPPLRQYYRRVRSIYVDEGNSDALPMLAKYRTAEAKRLIFDALKPRKKNVVKEVACEEPVLRIRKVGVYDRRDWEQLTIKDIYDWHHEENYLLNNAYAAVANWPCQDFIPIVKQMYKQGVLNDDSPGYETVFKALLGYQEPWAYELVRQALGTLDGDPYEAMTEWRQYCFLEAFGKNPSAYYRPLAMKYAEHD